MNYPEILTSLRNILFACCAAVLLSVPGCSGGVGTNGDVVGGPCTGNDQCEERCLSGGDFPQGTCAVPCANDSQCPDGTFCIATEGGVCLLGCQLPSDCRGGYTCKGKQNQGHAGESLVCYKD